MADSKPPQVFISYSWESQPHRDWVRYLAEKLRRNGVDARLDQWTVKPGGSFTHFMEAEVAEADYVLVVCTPTYAQKSNARAGGVGYEQQIVSGQLASGTRREKFIPIVRAGTYEAGDDGAIPTQFLGIVTIDFRDDAAFSSSLEQLLRALLDIPEVAPPPLGDRPSLKTQRETRFSPQEDTSMESVTEDLTATDAASPSPTVSVEPPKKPGRMDLPDGLILRDGKILSETDGAEMVLIPAGEFEMGDHFNEGSSNERPVHKVSLDAFYMDVYEVTNARYKKFMDAAGHEAPTYWNDARVNPPDLPVVGVSWYDAAAYCQWAGKRLPTEAEWEYAARGRLVGKKYPWGDENPDTTRASYGQDWSTGKPVSVGSFPPNGYGLYDMAGNVWEWCMDEWDSGFYANSPRDNPIAGGAISLVNNKFTSVKTVRVVRGGSWFIGVNDLRVALRLLNTPTDAGSNNGFRCAGSVTP